MFISAILRQKWHSAGELAQHLLAKNGPQTTQQLWKLTQAVDAPAEKEYIAPHHRDYRIIDGVIHGATVRPPNPKHLVRSVRHLKQTLQGLEATSNIGHMQAFKWMTWTDHPELQDMHVQAKELRERNKAAGESDYIWVDGERYHKAKPYNKPVWDREQRRPRLPLGATSNPSASTVEA